MKKFVSENLNDFLNEKKYEGYKKVRKQKATAKTPAKTTAVVDETTEEKAKRAIADLKKALEKASPLEKKGIQDKIDKWEAKLKK